MSMKKRLAFVFTALLASVVSVALYAEPKVDYPHPNEVVIVFRASFTPDVDRDFFSHYAVIRCPLYGNTSGKSSEQGELPRDSMSLLCADDASSWGSWYHLDDSSGLCMLKLRIPKTRTIDIAAIRYFLYGESVLNFTLPILRKIVVPEGANYVYLGSFTYTIADEYFRVSDITLSDEYDGAQAKVAKIYGESARLVRVNLIKLDTWDKR